MDVLHTLIKQIMRNYEKLNSKTAKQPILPL